jgi:putative nucleotidyltransferase with HDIG domain
MTLPAGRILFVDDEEDVLEALEDLLRPERYQFEMVFAKGAEAALAALARMPFDAIVSDMRMPVMDGAELLTRCKTEFPSTARIILTGHADKDSILRAVPVAHQILDKPCDPAILRKTLRSALAVREVLYDDRIRRAVMGAGVLPPVPRLYLALTGALRNDAGAPELASILERDPSMCAKVLQVVNSAYFGLPHPIVSVSRAVAHLGIEMMRALVLMAEVFGSDQAPGPAEGFPLKALQQHSLTVARVSKALIQDSKLADEALMSGTVHDIGKVVLAYALPNDFRRATRIASEQGRPIHEAEREVFGMSHAEVGAYLLLVWGMPLSIVDAVAHHHTPNAARGESLEILTAIHVADALVHELDPAERPGSRLQMEYLVRVGAVSRLPEWRAITARVATLPAS